MYEVSDLLPHEVVNWLIERLREYRQSGENARIELYVQNGTLQTYWGAPINKVSGKKQQKQRTT